MYHACWLNRRRAEPIAVPAEQSYVNLPSSLPLSVLVIEDKPDTAESLAKLLEIVGGFRVRVAHDGAAGLAAAIADTPDAVVCDIGLPKMDGFEVARELAAVTCRTLLIAVTGYGSAADREKARAAGFDHFFLKPADPFEIIAILRAHRLDG